MYLLSSNRIFRRFWFSGLLNQISWWALHAVMLLQVFELTGSSFATGLIPVFSSLPGMLLGTLAGSLLDKWNRQRVMVACACLQASMLLGSLVFASDLQVWMLYAIISTQSALMTFSAPAENSLLPNLVSASDLQPANALNALNDGIARIVGPALGVGVFVRLGLAETLVLCALIYGTAAGVLTGLRHIDEQTSRTHIAAIPGFNLRLSGTNRLIILPVVVWALYMLADVQLSAVLPAFMRGSVGVSAEFFGNSMSVRGVTGLLGGALVVWASRRASSRTLLVTGLLIQGSSYAMLGIANDPLWSVLVLVPIGPAAAAIETGLFTSAQRAAPPEVRGRVFGLIHAVNSVVVLVVSISAGAVAEGVGTRPVVIAAGCAHLLPLIAARRMRSIRA